MKTRPGCNPWTHVLVFVLRCRVQFCDASTRSSSSRACVGRLSRSLPSMSFFRERARHVILSAAVAKDPLFEILRYARVPRASLRMTARACAKYRKERACSRTAHLGDGAVRFADRVAMINRPRKIDIRERDAPMRAVAQHVARRRVGRRCRRKRAGRDVSQSRSPSGRAM